ncbi:hypothetical protein HanPSC8_Chr08g0329091 [Helianthus annuus]|nr:hypothetical protein HanPSC8_Chr08g0329091 [Helianthus annuus]
MSQIWSPYVNVNEFKHVRRRCKSVTTGKRKVMLACFGTNITRCNWIHMCMRTKI